MSAISHFSSSPSLLSKIKSPFTYTLFHSLSFSFSHVTHSWHFTLPNLRLDQSWILYSWLAVCEKGFFSVPHPIFSIENFLQTVWHRKRRKRARRRRSKKEREKERGREREREEYKKNIKKEKKKEEKKEVTYTLSNKLGRVLVYMFVYYVKWCTCLKWDHTPE